MENYDALLHRPVDEGKEFNELIPEPNGKKVLIGVGDTRFSIKKMAEMVKAYSYQVKKVADELQSDSLAESVDNVKDFVFNHFQYKADKEDQLLRSPAYAWWIDGFEGIDCKSYSIIASCILTEMGILHSIRRIKQPTHEPTQWTHVYVVVPVDQKNGNLQNGYYVIDGTLEEDYEPMFVEKDDLPMNLKHYSLNAPATTTGLGLSIGSFNLNNLLSVKNLFSSIGCLGGSYYNANRIKIILTAMNKYMNDLILEMNQAVKDGDESNFSDCVAEYFAVSQLYYESCTKKLATESWNPCSTAGIKTVAKGWEFFNTVGKKALTEWLNQNFTEDFLLHGQSTTFTTDQLFAQYGLGASLANQSKTIIPKFYNPKAKQINAFEFTPYLETATATNFNPLTFIESLSTVLVNFSGSTNPTNPNSDTIIDGGGLTPTTQTAGFGVLGWVVLFAGLGLTVKAFANSPDEPATATRKKTTSKTTAK